MAGVFDLRTPADLLDKLHRELERLRAEPNNADHAFNFFVTAEHMLDWIYPGSPGKAKRKALHKNEILLRVVSQLANSAKHLELFDVPDAVQHSGLGRQWRGPHPILRRVFDGSLGVRLGGQDATAALGLSILAIDLAERVYAYWSATGRLQ